MTGDNWFFKGRLFFDIGFNIFPKHIKRSDKT